MLEGQIPRVHAARTGGLGLVQAGVVNEGLVALLRMIPAERVVVDAALKNLKQRCNSAADLVHGGSRVVIRRKLVLDEGEVRSQKLDEASGLLQRTEGLPLVLGELASLLAILGDPTAQSVERPACSAEGSGTPKVPGTGAGAERGSPSTSSSPQAEPPSPRIPAAPEGCAGPRDARAAWVLPQ